MDALEAVTDLGQEMDDPVDGRVDLVVTQNGAQTKLYRNRLAKPGLRIRLRASTANPYAVGAVIRLRYDNDELGPAREIRQGSGWLTQNALTQTLGMKRHVRAVEVRWPGGRTTSTKLPKGVFSVEIDETGRIVAPPAD